MKKVSVIVTTYNGAKSISSTLTSIMEQKGINEKFLPEIFVIDDCSTDNTVEIVKQFNVNLLSTEKNSGGPNKGRNIGLRKCTGDYICIVDQDDIWKPERVISLIPYLEKVPVVSSGFTIDYGDGKQRNVVQENSEGFVFYEKNKTFFKKMTKSTIGQNFYMGSIMFRSELKENYFEEKYGMVDFDWGLRLFHLKESIEVCAPLYIRKIDGTNLSLNEKYRLNDFNYSLQTLELYQNHYPKEVLISNLRIHGTMGRFYYVRGEMKKARYYFVRSQWNFKTAAYYLTTFIGSSYVKKYFTIFG